MPVSTTNFRDAALLGVLAGCRSAAAPALLAEYLRRQAPAAPLRRPFSRLATPRVAPLTKVAALGELVGDKLPNTPDRIAAGPLGGRVAAGALVGSTLAALADEPVVVGAFAGGAAAAAAAYAAYLVRRWLGQRLPVPDPLLGLAEDAVVYGIGLRWLRRKTE